MFCSDKLLTLYFLFPKGGELSETDVISSLNVDSQLQCSHECLTEPGCISFNYRSQTTAETSRQVNCQLSNKTRDEIITEDGEWTFYQDLQTVSFVLT